jgi:TonB family protein
MRINEKMKYIIHIISFLTGFGSIEGQVLTDTMYFNNSWEQSTREEARYYRIINMDPSVDFMFHVWDYYLSGQVQMTGTYRSIRPDDREGIFTWYFPNGNKQQECTYRNNQLHGLYQEWFENGQSKTRQNFFENVLDGPVKEWRKDGTLQLEAHYNKGEKHGFFISYYANGQMARKELYDYGQFIEGQCFTIDGQPSDFFPYVTLPSFVGGPPELQKFIKNELKYPKRAEKEGREATILILFTVDEKGRIQNPRVIHGDTDDFNEEAIRIVNSFPDWIPGKIDGTPAPLQATVQIDFTLY